MTGRVAAILSFPARSQNGAVPLSRPPNDPGYGKKEPRRRQHLRGSGVLSNEGRSGRSDPGARVCFRAVLDSKGSATVVRPARPAVQADADGRVAARRAVVDDERAHDGGGEEDGDQVVGIHRRNYLMVTVALYGAPTLKPEPLESVRTAVCGFAPVVFAMARMVSVAVVAPAGMVTSAGMSPSGRR